MLPHIPDQPSPHGFLCKPVAITLVTTSLSKSEMRDSTEQNGDLLEVLLGNGEDDIRCVSRPVLSVTPCIMIDCYFTDISCLTFLSWAVSFIRKVVVELVGWGVGG